MDTTLLVMAAGMGSRFGKGIKQLTPIGPNGELIIDYSIHDAVEAGFNKVVFVIRKDIEDEFRKAIGDRISKVIKVEYAYQNLEDIPEGFAVPSDRTKPWGTGQAVLSAKDLIHEPFIIINADDYYGKEGFKVVHDYMVEHMDPNKSAYDICMAGFILKNTLSLNGGVTRGVCQVDGDFNLTDVTETFEIIYDKDGQCKAKDEDGNLKTVDAESYVSMNMWGCPASFMDSLEDGFVNFLKTTKDPVKGEYLLPTFINELINENRATVRLLVSHDRWFGVTYQQDKEKALEEIAKRIEDGVYPHDLYGDK